MDGNTCRYDHAVTVSTESGELLGPGHFVGDAGVYRSTGKPRWSGELHTNIDPLVLVSAGILSLEFNNGIVGYAICKTASITASSTGVLFRVRLIGDGDPPKADP